MRNASFVTLLFLVLTAGLIALQKVNTSHATIASTGQQQIEMVGGHEAAAGRVILKYRDPNNRSARQSITQTLDVDSDRELGGTGARLMHSRSRTAAALVAELSQRDDIWYAEPDCSGSGGATPNDSFFASQQWGLRNTGQVIGGQSGTADVDISATLAWDVSTGDPNQVMAILDSGIDYNHPDLAPNVWTSAAGFSVTLG